MKYYFALLILILTLNCSSIQKSENENLNLATPALITDSIITADCVFKTNLDKECWTRIGSYPIDKAAEDYACELNKKEITHILVAKYIGDNGAFPNESAYVLWVDSDKEYIKEFYTTGNTTTIEKPKRELNWEVIRTTFETIRLDTVSTRPQLKMIFSHNIGFAIQYSSNNIFFCERLQDNQWKAAIDETHPKVMFWNALTELLQPTTDR
jgi:hypothetical protein